MFLKSRIIYSYINKIHLRSEKLYVDKIFIENYKSISKLTINCDPKFNVIIGENNIGKSTVFEALLLWKQCFDCSILVTGNRFYKPSNNKYILFNELDF